MSRLSGLVVGTVLLGLSSAGVARPRVAPSAPAEQRRGSWLEAQIRRFRSYPHLDRAYRLIRRGELGQARAELERFLEIAPADVKARRAYMDVLYRLGDYQETIRQAGILLSRSPGRTPVFLYRGLARLALDRLDRAEEDFTTAAEQAGAASADRVFALNTLVDLALRRADDKGALEWLDRMPPSARDTRFFYRRGLCLERLGRWAEAESAYRRSLELTTEASQRLFGYRALAEILKKRRDWTGAREALTSALSLAPDDVDLMRSLGQVAYQEGEKAVAAEWFQRVVASRPRAEDREFLAHLLVSLGAYEQAAVELEAVLGEVQAPAERHRVLVSLGNVYAAWGREDDALRVLERALAQKPTADVHERLAVLYAGRGEKEKALEHIERADTLGLPAERHASALRQMGTLDVELGRYPEAARAFEEALSLEPGQRYAKKSLALAYEKMGRLDDALRLYEELLRGAPDRREILTALGHLEMRRGRYTQAAARFEEAFKAEGEPSATLLAAWAEALSVGGRWEEAIRINHRLMAMGDLTPEQRADTLERLGYAYSAVKTDEEALFYLERAIEAGRDRRNLRENLGLVLYRLGRWREALEEFLRALDEERTPETLAYTARCLERMDRPGLAIHYLREAAVGIDRFRPEEQVRIWNELGFLYAQEADYARAAEAWSRSLELAEAPEIALRLGRMHRLLARWEGARRVLEGIVPAALPEELEAQRLEELARVYEHLGRGEEALQSIERASAVSATANRFYRWGLLLREREDLQGAAGAFQEAVRHDPATPRYAEALGYTFEALGKTEEAIGQLESVLARDPGYLSLYPELGYLYMRKPDNAAARKWFRLAIDNEPFYPIRSKQEAERLGRDIFRFRREVRKLSNRFDVSFYTSLRSGAVGAPAPAVAGSGVLASQGGLELSFEPPRWGFRNERVLQGFLRVLWDHAPGSLRWDEASFQGGLGIRYKPLKRQNLYGSFERLFAIGERARDNWLLRGLYSWDAGYDLRAGRDSWSYTFVYGEGGFFLQKPKSSAVYGEGREGWTFNFSDALLLTPHVVLDGRRQDPPTAVSDYVEAGPGLSVKVLFNRTRYEAHRSSFELLLQYRWGRFVGEAAALDAAFSGWVVGGLLRF